MKMKWKELQPEGAEEWVTGDAGPPYGTLATRRAA